MACARGVKWGQLGDEEHMLDLFGLSAAAGVMVRGLHHEGLLLCDLCVLSRMLLIPSCWSNTDGHPPQATTRNHQHHALDMSLKAEAGAPIRRRVIYAAALVNDLA